MNLYKPPTTITSRPLFNGFEHSKLYVVGMGWDGMGWVGYLLGPTFRAPYGAKNKSG